MTLVEEFWQFVGADPKRQVYSSELASGPELMNFLLQEVYGGGNHAQGIRMFGILSVRGRHCLLKSQFEEFIFAIAAQAYVNGQLHAKFGIVPQIVKKYIDDFTILRGIDRTEKKRKEVKNEKDV